MLSLSKKLINHIDIDGVRYELDLDFTTVLKFLRVIKNEDVPVINRIDLSYNLLVKSPKTEDFQIMDKVVYEIFENIIVEKENVPKDLKGNPMPVRRKKDENGNDFKAFCYEQDAKYIYSAFLQEYNIDLFDMQGEMHWHKFSALLESLSDKTRFKQIIEIRTSKPPKDKESLKNWRRLRRIFALK